MVSEWEIQNYYLKCFEFEAQGCAMQNIGDPRRKIKCCCRSSSSPAFLCISKNYFHPFQSPWNCSLSRGFKVELEMFLIKFFLRVRLIHTNCPVLHWKNKTWQRKSKLTLLKTLCECMCFQGSCSIVWVWSLGQPGPADTRLASITGQYWHGMAVSVTLGSVDFNKISRN